ncbi:CHAD domain-containing protein [Thalassobaculum sp.]|uniref:CYTH and CHAD domain-containing protein n=1 Tax=Thalassobaculum sp. TaxID=2022740 RepID=UPI0032EE2853
MNAPPTFVPQRGWSADHRALAAVVDAVKGSLNADPAQSQTVAVVLRDTPDRRLARQGYRLSCTPVDAGLETWSLFEPDGTLDAEAVVALPAPAFADEVQKGRLRSRLGDLAKGRTLLPVIEITVTETVVALRDGDGKIRCRLALTQVATAGAPAETDLTVHPLKGYGRDAGRVEARIADALGWSRSRAPALSRLETRAAGVSEAGGGALHADDPAGPAMREILSAQLDVMEDRLPGVLADRHPDYLHQFRVAIRRTRSALSQLPDAIALEGRPEAVEGFRWLGQITSPVRDLDVQLMDLAERRQRAGDDGPAMEALERHLRGLKTTAHRDLVLALSGSRFQRLAARWRDTLSPSSANWTATDTLRAPFAEIVSARAAKLLRKTLREGRRIGPDSPAETLHDLRKRMKKLRYVTEFLAEVLPPDRTKPAIKALKGLQDVLGRVQDREIQVEALHGYGRALAGRKGGSAETLMAIGAWSEELERDRRAARAEFAAAFDSFSAKETQALFHDIFAAPGMKPGSASGVATGSGKPDRRGPEED